MHVHLRIAGALLILTTALTGCRGVSPPEPTAINDTAVAALSTAGLWTETFDRLDLARWIPSSWSGFWQQPGLTGTFQPDNAYVDGKGHLVLALKVQSCGAGLCAQAAEVQSTQLFGFGRYT
ncbi:hypothetical protein, partial [Deinococcus saxicola]|uniref:hypothetical protein n=2 Tax=Deinococcus saxicola TaxID=249406 RepID=UPI0039EFB237